MLCISYVTDSYSIVCFFITHEFFKVDFNFQFCLSDGFYAHCMNYLSKGIMTKLELHHDKNWAILKGSICFRTPEKQMKIRTGNPEVSDSLSLDSGQTRKLRVWVIACELQNRKWNLCLGMLSPDTADLSGHPAAILPVSLPPELDSDGDNMRYGWGSVHGSPAPPPPMLCGLPRGAKPTPWQ